VIEGGCNKDNKNNVNRGYIYLKSRYEENREYPHKYRKDIIYNIIPKRGEIWVFEKNYFNQFEYFNNVHYLIK
jgi:hypothetical protein